MITTADYILKAVVDGEVLIFQYEAKTVWEALNKFWTWDYSDIFAERAPNSVFPIDVMPMDGGRVIHTYKFMFNVGVFHAFFDNGHTAAGIYTLDQFAKDIKRDEEHDPKQLTAMMDRWAGFCYNHPPYDDVILWMVGGSKQHYLYEHFCAKWLHICENVCHNDTMATWIRFYRELDSVWSKRLMQYVYCEWKKTSKQLKQYEL